MTDQPTFEYDVFISYSSKDKTWVRGELLKRIEKARLKAFIDYRDFARGQPSIKEIERGVKKCRKTLLVLTPTYLKSEWCEFESLMAATLSPANRKKRLIPVLKTPCKKPLRINLFTHIDFTDGADLDLAWRQLLTALGAPPEQKPPDEPARDEWFLAHPYPMPPNFTGRVAERQMLTDWLEKDTAHPLLVLRALGGFGKSALVWHWLTHDVSPATWPRVVWWSFYEGDSSFDHFLERTVEYLKVHNQSELGPRQRVDALVKLLHHPGTLVVVDGFERALRAFGGLNAPYQGDETAAAETNERDCMSPFAEFLLRGVATLPDIRSRVLLTTRLCPRILEARGSGLVQGCREEELRQMQPAEAVEFFHAQGVRGTRAEIEGACEPYGYHPLSLRLLTGLIVGDFRQPGDIATAKRLDVAGDLVARQHHVLETAYNSLTQERRALLGRIACFRSPVQYKALRALADAYEQGGGLELDSDLRDLIARGLLHHDAKEGRFELHTIVRRYAYDRLTASDRAAAHTRLREYFAAVPTPDKVTRLEELAAVIELYHHTICAGQYDEAARLIRDRLVPRPLHYQFGAYQLIVDLLQALFPDGEHCPPRLKDKDDQGWAMNALASSYGLSGQPRRAVSLLAQHIEIRKAQAAKRNLAVGLGNLASRLRDLGELHAAQANLHRRIAICLEIKDTFVEAAGHRQLGWLLALRGAYAEAETELATAMEMAEEHNYIQMQAVNWAQRALSELLLLRSGLYPGAHTLRSALDSACRSLALANERAHKRRPNERDYVRALWVLGAAHRVAGQPDKAEKFLLEALERCRRVNMVDHEADVLIDLARLHAATGTAEEAHRLAEEALLIAERSEYVLQGADTHLELANLALARGEKAVAMEHATEAKRLATCDGPPDYSYKVAYDEACALLKQLQS